LRAVSLFELVEIVSDTDNGDSAVDFDKKRLPSERPLLAVHHKLMRFLKDVTLSDLVMPGRRIDVPVELVGRQRQTNEITAAVVG
jgi:hypothetical protein